ncbi:P-type DNA transfer ATPase VirB11 [Glaciimonas sp. GNP009]
MTQEKSTLAIHLEPLSRFLSDSDVTEICINEPHKVFIEGRVGWTVHLVEALTFDWCMDAAKLIANWANQSITEESPMLSAQLPDGERVQIVLPPTVPSGTVSITIRRPSTSVMSLDEIIDTEAFANARCEQSLRLTAEERKTIEDELPDHDKKLLELFHAKKWKEFLTQSVLRKKNIISSGQTGSGKTTLGNALIAIIPLTERIITVEDVREARLPHENLVSMVYSKDNKGLAKVTPKQIFEGNLRQRPDRVLPAELRGDEAFFFIQNVINSGHPGTITTVHANRAKLAFMRLSFMIKASPEGAGISREDILETLYALIDVIVQMERLPTGQRVVSEVYFDPAFAAKQLG